MALLSSGCLTPCKIIILETKLSPNEFFDFEPSTPPTWAPLFWGGRVKIWFGLYSASIQIQVPRSHSTFSFYMDALTNDGGPGSYL